MKKCPACNGLKLIWSYGYLYPCSACNPQTPAYASTNTKAENAKVTANKGARGAYSEESYE